MTYKKIVEGLVERDSRDWVEKLLCEMNIPYKYIFVDVAELEKDKDNPYWIYYTCKTDVYLSDYEYKHIEVGGTVDSMGVSHSVIWNANRKIIWMSVEKTRQDLGITEFKWEGVAI